MIAEVVERVLVWTLCSVQHPHVVVARCTHEIIGGSYGSVARIGGVDADHSVYILLNVLHQSLYDVHLPRTIENESLDRMVNLLLVLADVAHLQEFFLIGPLSSLRVRVRLVLNRRIAVVEGSGIRQAPP